MLRFVRWTLLLACCVPCWTGAALAEDAPEPAKVEFFEKRVRPLLAEHCFKCHGEKKQEGGLRLDSFDNMMKGGDSGPAIVPGNAKDSLVIDAVNYGDTVQMPPNERLTKEQIEQLTEWIADGAVWPKDPKPKSSGKSTLIRDSGEITAADRAFWSFQPVSNPAPPAVNDVAWPKNDVDRFVLAQLERQGLKLVAAADKRTLIRRATFDLIGLPPTIDEIAAFLADDAPDAFAKVVDRLLASPHYGERWGRHWLDVARYGEDQAHTFQARMYPQGYRYRDWIVQALNDDMPYDQFVVEQIAADLLPGEDRAKHLPALGYFALGPVYYGDAGCGGKAGADELDDRVDVLSRGFLGLTVSCARCHDHKFDPIPTQDYYSLAGIFRSSQYQEAALAPAEEVAVYEKAQGVVKSHELEVTKHLDAQAALLAEQALAQTAAYVQAAFDVRASRLSDKPLDLGAVAKERKLRDFSLQKVVEHLDKRAADKHPLHECWQRLTAKVNAKSDATDVVDAAEVAKLADELQAELTGQLARRSELSKEQAATLAAWIGDKGVFAIPKKSVQPLLSKEAKQQLAKLKETAEQAKRELPAKYAVAHALTEGQPEDMPVFVRGNREKKGDPVPRRFLAVLSPEERAPFKQGSGRLELAYAIASKDNPLTARVLVNRVWQHHFGRGLVATPSNFGQLGQRPSHPELLDRLAAKFMDGGWSIKSLHRKIMLSATYQLGSGYDDANFQVDPENRLLWRMNRQRLEVEAWRDAMLAVSGRLDSTLGGPSQNLTDADNRRRTFYGAVSRHDLNGLLRLFDFPDPNLTSDQRTVTTVPLQQLFVLNADFLVQQAKSLVERLAKEAGDNDSDNADRVRLARAFELLYGRPAKDMELQVALEFLHDASAPEVRITRWEQLAQALLGANEFLYVD